MDDRLPWTQLMQIGFGVLRLTPESFWRMTPCEWMSGLKGWMSVHGMADVENTPIQRRELNTLMQRFPDNIFMQEE